MEDNNQSKINKQPEVPENQTAWNSDNQGIKETANQTNQTGEKGGQREPAGRRQTSRAGLAERTMERWRSVREGLAPVNRQTRLLGMTEWKTETQN